VRACAAPSGRPLRAERCDDRITVGDIVARAELTGVDLHSLVEREVLFSRTEEFEKLIVTGVASPRSR
jgi:hypothetical protein